MKKFLMIFAGVCMFMLTTVSLTSCSGDSNDDEASATIKKYELKLEVTPTADMLKYADMAITVTDDNGTQTYNVDSQNYTKTIATYTNFPVNGTIEYTAKQKEGVSPNDEDLVKWNSSYNLTVVWTKSDGTTGSYSDSFGGSKSIKGSNLSKYLSDGIMHKSFVINKDGVISFN